MKIMKSVVSLLLVGVLLAGCSQAAPSEGSSAEEEGVAYVDEVKMEDLGLEELEVIEDEAVALASAPAAVSKLLLPEAPGTQAKKSDQATIDYSNTKDGYVMVNYTAKTTKRLKVRVTGPKTEYTYDLPAGEWTTFPLADGNGTYKVKVFENTTGNKYSTVTSVSMNVKLTDEFAPFLRPNQFVDYEDATNTIAKAEELAGKKKDPMDKVAAIYNYVVKNIKYDTKLAATVKSGYLPDLDKVLKTKKGICFDYAALMTGMLRSQGVPCKLVVGYAGSAYHAWINVWSEEEGWLDGAIYFDGSTWQRMDPTFASSGKQSKAIMKYIGNGKNYKEKNLY